MTGSKIAALLLVFAVAVGSCLYSAAQGSGPAAPPQAVLDFEFFRTKVQPIFLKNRGEHARCYGCHILSNRILRLEPLSPGSTDWNDEQSHKNFQSALELVNSDNPAASKLLLHPLAPEAGGDPFHSGGRQFASQDDPDWRVMAEWVGVVHKESPGPLQPLIYVTSSAGDTIDAIDPAMNRVVQVIHGIELPHGIALSPDGARIYVSNEAESVLDVVDRKTGEIQSKIALSGRPNNLTITKDGSLVLVGIRVKSGALDVIDTASLKNVKSIPVDGPVHNVYVTPDSKFVVSGSIESKTVSVVDLQTQQMAWEVKFDKPVRPMAFDTNPDGSTRRIFVQLSTVHGFAVVDFAKRAEVARIKLPDQPSGFGVAEGRAGIPSHGIGVAPDGKSLWIDSTLANSVYEYSLPDLKLIGRAELPEVHPANHAPTGAIPDWIAFTPDSKFVYIADSALRLVSVIDAQTLKEVKQIPVGEVPKRMVTLVGH
jgi:YVTN family beta-propeller protein